MISIVYFNIDELNKLNHFDFIFGNQLNDLEWVLVRASQCHAVMLIGCHAVIYPRFRVHTRGTQGGAYNLCC